MKAKSAKDQFSAIKKAATERLDKISANEKIAGAAAMGIVVGAAAAAIGNSLRNDAEPMKATKAAKKPTA
ncbi:hypothetical protein [Aquisediminimonas profunda]|uniref:hypothetical protein n=1 Tax=Aquisediminimonas profunda TaxID=1550733 RepID=UPI001C62E2E2|nr:hypothetical protein [Aquisediminimonas profunda]